MTDDAAGRANRQWRCSGRV